MADFKRRAPTVDRLISSVNVEEDRRIALVGKITHIDKSGSICEFEDFSGKTILIVPHISILENVSEGEIYRVTGTILRHENGFELKVEIIQKINNLNMNIYKEYMRVSGNL
ncbi:MAG: OB-fold nucleic acid binding domain-containing protein [Candidatus Nanoarchaeia archaeon]